VILVVVVVVVGLESIVGSWEDERDQLPSNTQNRNDTNGVIGSK
jgi:hypothetical protein